MMHSTCKLALLGIGSVLLLHAVPVAAQCSLEDGYLADCLRSKFTAEAVVVVREPRYRLRLPNLRVRDVDVSASGVVSVEVENDGLMGSAAFDVRVIADRSPSNGVPSDDFETLLPFPPLDAGARHEVVAGQLYVPDNEHNWDIYVGVLVDMMDVNSPGGQIWESNEEDNVHEYGCRLLGMPPDYTGLPPC